MAKGFRDAHGRYLTDTEFSGVWLSDVPLTINEGTQGDTVLRVTPDVEETEIADWEWTEESLESDPVFSDPLLPDLRRTAKQYREWLLPAEFVNTHAKIELAESE